MRETPQTRMKKIVILPVLLLVAWVHALRGTEPGLFGTPTFGNSTLLPAELYPRPFFENPGAQCDSCGYILRLLPFQYNPYPQSAADRHSHSLPPKPPNSMLPGTLGSRFSRTWSISFAFAACGYVAARSLPALRGNQRDV
jgi:hypothetical protein